MTSETASRTARSFLQAVVTAVGVATTAVAFFHLPAATATEVGAAFTATLTLVTFLQNLLEELGRFPHLDRLPPTQVIADVEAAVKAALHDSGGLELLIKQVLDLEKVVAGSPEPAPVP